ncbi:hypothetical protein ACWM35_12805 [Neobacillus sp. K501]
MGEGSVHFEAMLAQYRKIWNNRILAVSDLNSEEILKEAVKRELLDENSHPRIRKNKFEKYYSAINRIVNSELTNEAKVDLIHVHNQIMDELRKE